MSRWSSELNRQVELQKAAYREQYPDIGEQVIETTRHPFAQVGPFIKVALYNQWNEAALRWEAAHIGNIYGLRFGTRGLGLVFRIEHRLPRGIVRFGTTSRANKNDGRTV